MRDLLLNSNKDLQIVNGDLAIGYSDEQQQKVLLVMKKGELKQDPDVGVGLSFQLKDDDVSDLLTSVRQQFTKDGMKVKKVSFENNQLNVDASYS